MKFFEMKNGSKYELQVNVAAAMRVRSRVKRRNGEPLDILKIVDIDGARHGNMDLLDELTSDSLLLVEIIYVLLEKQLNEKGISEEQFYTSLTGDDIETVTDLLMAELIDFFPDAKQRVLRAIWTHIETAQEHAKSKINEILNSEDFVQKLTTATDGILFGKVPESSE